MALSGPGRAVSAGATRQVSDTGPPALSGPGRVVSSTPAGQAGVTRQVSDTVPPALSGSDRVVSSTPAGQAGVTRTRTHLSAWPGGARSDTPPRAVAL